MNYQKILNVAQSFIRLNDQHFVYMNAPTYTNRDMLYNKIFIAHYKPRKESAWLVIFGCDGKYCSKYIGSVDDIASSRSLNTSGDMGSSCVFVTKECTIGFIKSEEALNTLKPMLDLMVDKINNMGEDYAKSFRDIIEIYKA